MSNKKIRQVLKKKFPHLNNEDFEMLVIWVKMKMAIESWLF